MRTNPVGRLIAAILLTTPLLLSVDWVSATVALVCELLILPPLVGLPLRRALRRMLPLLLLAPLSGVSMMLYGRPEGRVYAEFLFAHITDNSIALAVAITIRVLAVGVPVVVLTADLDPTELGDGLAQILRLPAPVVLSVVAALRLTGLFIEDWTTLAMARRARGLGDSGRVKRLFTMAFALLVCAVRRGTTLATAMEARGLSTTAPRTWARPSRLGRGDAVLLGVSVLIAVVALGASVASGAFRFLGA